MKEIALALMQDVGSQKFHSVMKNRLFGTGKNVLFFIQFCYEINFSHGIDLITRCYFGETGKLET